MTYEQLCELKEKTIGITEPGEIEKYFKIETPYNRLKNTVNDFPDYPALLYFGNKITYKEMLDEVDLLARGLSRCGIKKDDIVTVSLLATPYSIILFYALMKIGAVAHMVNCSASKDEIKREMSNFETKHFIANDLLCNEDIRNMAFDLGIEIIIAISTLDGMPRKVNRYKMKYGIIQKLKGIKAEQFDGKKLVSLAQLKKLGLNANEVSACEFEANRMTAIAYTSGSTGESKAVVATYESMDSMVYCIGLTEDKDWSRKVAFTTFPLWIYYSLVNMIHEPLNVGMAISLDPLFDAKSIANLNKIYKFNLWQTIPPYIKQVVDVNKKTDCSHWELILTGGDSLDESLKKRVNDYIARNKGTVKIGSGYGASELMGGATYPYYPEPSEYTVGKPVFGAFIKVLDVDTGVELGANQTGIGYIHAPTLMKEYYGNAEATDHNLVKDDKGVIWYNTEDLIHYNERGEVFIDGRLRRIVLTLDSEGNPAKIIPDRVKRELLKNSAIDKCEIITVPDSLKENVAVACVVLKKKENVLSKNDIIEYCNNSVPEYMVPVDVLFIDEMPLAATQKPDLKELERIWREQAV